MLVYRRVSVIARHSRLLGAWSPAALAGYGENVKEWHSAMQVQVQGENVDMEWHFFLSYVYTYTHDIYI